MDPKELEEYKKKIKGLSLKELNDILSHINKDKVPEKYQAIMEEIALRTGAPMPMAQPPAEKAVPSAPEAARPSTEPAGPAAPPLSIHLRKSKVSFAEEKAKPTQPPAPPKRSEVPAAKEMEEAPVAAPIAPKPISPKAQKVAAPANLSNVVFAGLAFFFVIAGIYIVLVPFVNLPGATAIRAIWLKLPFHF